MKKFSRRCWRLRKVTLHTSTAFIGKSWPTNLNKNLDLEENVMKYETFRYFKEYCFLETGGSNSLEKDGKKTFRKREVHYSLRSKIQTGTPEKRWFKTASNFGEGPVTLFWIKYSKKIQNS